MTYFKSASKNALYQKLPLSKNNSFLISRFTSPYFETPWHFHEEYELVYCEKGFGKKIIGNNFSEYQEGDMAFIGKNVPHLFAADESFYDKDCSTKPSSIVLQFSEDFLGDRFFNSSEMHEMKQILKLSANGLLISGKSKDNIRDLLLNMLQSEKIARLNLLITIFDILSSSTDLSPLSLDTINGFNGMDSIKMNSVLEYSLENYKEHISIEEAAKRINLSPSAFCRYFKSRTQKTYLGFIIEMRLNEACKLLKDSDLAIIEICYRSGFKNLSNFNRSFRKQFGMNPVAYRRTK